MTRQRAEAVLWVLVLLVLPATIAVLATRPGAVPRARAGHLLLASPVLIGCVALWIAGPRGRSSWTVLVAVLGGAGLGAAGALWGRGEFGANMYLALVWFAGAGILALGLFLFILYRLGAVESFSRVARRAFATAICLGAFGLVSLGGGRVVHAWDVSKAMAWIEQVAELVEDASSRSGRYPAMITDLLPRAGPRPRLVTEDDWISYQPTEVGFELAFGDPAAFVWGEYVYTAPEGTWRHTVD